MMQFKELDPNTKYFTVSIRKKGTKAILHECVTKTKKNNEQLSIPYLNKHQNNLPAQQLVLKSDFSWSQIPDKKIYIGMPKDKSIKKYIVLFEIEWQDYEEMINLTNFTA